MLLSFSISAETVILRSHDVVHGKITFQDANVLRMNDDLGKPVEIQKSEILKVSYRDVKDAKEIKKIIEEEESKLPPEKRKGAKAPDKKRTVDIVWRSALIPGWGLWKADKKWLAAFAFVAVAGAGGYAVSKFHAFEGAQSKYQTTSVSLFFITQSNQNLSQPQKLVIGVWVGQQTFKPYGEAQTTGNNAIQALGAIYAIQLIHAFFVGRDYAKDAPAKGVGTKTAYGDINFNAVPRQAITPTGLGRETYYEMNYSFEF